MSTMKQKRIILRLKEENHDLLKWAARLSGKSMNQLLEDMVENIANHKVEYLQNAISASAVLSKKETTELMSRLTGIHPNNLDDSKVNEQANEFEKKSKKI